MWSRPAVVTRGRVRPWTTAGRAALDVPATCYIARAPVTGAFATHPILRIRSPIIGRGEQVFELTGNVVTIGRAEECDVVLLEQSASRVHARLLPENGAWVLVDEGSHAGVFVGAQKVTRHVLGDGERFRIGETDFQLVWRPASQPTLVGATRPPMPEPAAPVPSIGSAPTIASGTYSEADVGRVLAPASLSVAPLEMPGAPAPAVPPRAAAPAPIPVVQAPAPAPRPVPPASAPSFVDFGSVGRPDVAPAESQSFTGRLADDPSRADGEESRVTSRYGTWIVVVLLFVGMSLLVVGLAYDITVSDVLSVFD